ncbi:CAP domain-containing protein [Sulfitobacter albidus]|uniref:CAP domain-containing protein n=1 Tax=Sulfitobacter albidus TaxID=2829501 RepID=A0A975JD22_9RHOB|nr:CAP domain-containing protein [Sulfitobacter albidus]QUJ76208.1 CAP domain-containing protein [Sulfitobacter albidus]
MIRVLSALFAAMMLLAACQPAAPTLGSDGQPVPRAYKITAREADQIPFRMLDSVNTLRGASGLVPLQLNSQLTAAAATHSRDMQVQNRPWHFGSDGSSPLDRVQRVGYSGQLVGEVISETYETELETLGAWMAQPDTRRIIMSPEARDMGFSWFQESNGKIWWTLVMGAPQGSGFGT